MSPLTDKLKRMLVFGNWLNPDMPENKAKDGGVPLEFTDLCGAMAMAGIENDLPRLYRRPYFISFLQACIVGDWENSTDQEIKYQLNRLAPTLFEPYRAQVEEYLRQNII